MLPGLQLGIAAAYELAVDFLIPGGGFFLDSKKVFQTLLLGQMILFPFLHTGLQLTDKLIQLTNRELFQPVTIGCRLLPAFHKTAELIPYSGEFADFRLCFLYLPAHPAIENHAFLHILDVDILFHTDIFLHELFQTDIHAKRYGTFEKPGEFLHIQAAQVHIIQIPAEPFIIRCTEPFLL